ncbi:four helix bundle protein [Lacibacter sp. MH-610]|uniref:four helix bundle protein n=1 Tax=Lacibacter sp. MH-610 TaxID=3020883 RepID=UPI0038915C15
MQKELIDNNPILKLSIEFAKMILDYCDVLQEMKKYTISTQLLKSGTSIGANCMEAQNAESKADFIHKIKIAAKEADETQYWLVLCSYGNNYPDTILLEERLTEIQKVINKILGTAKRKHPFSYILSFFIF